MAISRVFIASILLSLFVLHLSEADQMANTNGAPGYPSPTAPMDCGAACAARCRLASRQKLCKRACGTCCARCNCVPPGTSGNTEVCPCYATMTTHGGRLKCP